MRQARVQMTSQRLRQNSRHPPQNRAAHNHRKLLCRLRETLHSLHLPRGTTFPLRGAGLGAIVVLSGVAPRPHPQQGRRSSLVKRKSRPCLRQVGETELVCLLQQGRVEWQKTNGEKGQLLASNLCLFHHQTHPDQKRLKRLQEMKRMEDSLLHNKPLR